MCRTTVLQCCQDLDRTGADAKDGHENDRGVAEEFGRDSAWTSSSFEGYHTFVIHFASPEENATEAAPHVGVTLRSNAIGGVLVTRVHEDDAAYASGLRRGHVITHINDIEVHGHRVAVDIIEAAREHRFPLRLSVLRTTRQHGRGGAPPSHWLGRWLTRWMAPCLHTTEE
jgi:hypothetical protein